MFVKIVVKTEGALMGNDWIKTAIGDSAKIVSSLSSESGAIGAICDSVVKVLKSGGKVLTAGNGGSAAESLHMAEELTGRYKKDRRSLPGVALVADSTALTCIGNDYGFDYIFSRQVEGLGVKGDALVLFSTSGNARNLSLALDAAREKEILTVCLLGRDGGSLAGRADHEIIVKSVSTERIQEAHQVVLHIVLEAVDKAFG